jgi:hypothetical protein
MRLDYDLDEDDDTGFEPWALGDQDPEPLENADVVDDTFSDADSWLDEQLGQLRPDGSQSDGRCDPVGTSDSKATSTVVAEGGGGEVVLRRRAPARSRRRRADLDAASDLPPVVVAGYVRDRRGTWRYAATGQAVPGARDLTLRSLYRFPVSRCSVLVPVHHVRTEAELGWCMAWIQTMTTALHNGRIETVFRIPVGEWERRADIPLGLWAPELAATRLVGVADVARLVGVTPATITAYLARRRMPAPVVRIGNSPMWSRPVIHHWLGGRPGQGVRPRG